MSATSFANSRWAVAAGLILVGMGAPIGLFGIVLIGQGLAYDDRYNMGYGTLATVIGAIVLLIGAFHVVAGTFIWRHRAWARALGIVIAFLGGLLATTLLPTAFNPVYVSGGDFGELIDTGPNPRSMLIGLSLIPYVLALIGLVLSSRHFRRV